LALQGALDAFPLPDVLRVLAQTSKTGHLHLEGDRGRGGVWFDEGAVVAVDADRSTKAAPLDERLFELLRFRQGIFRFTPDETLRQPTEDPQELDGILRSATRLADEWRELERVVPSLAHHVALAPALQHEQVLLDAGSWSSLVAIGDGRSVAELADRLGLGELGVARVLTDLVELGMVVVEEPDARTNLVTTGS